MSVRLQQKELEIVNELHDEFIEMNFRTQRESSAAISKREKRESWLVTSEHQVKEMVQNLTDLEQNFNS